MWLFTPKGFFSVVIAQGGKDEVMIRARVKADLENLKKEHEPALKIIETKYTDYRYRAIVPRRVFLAMLVELGDEVTYPNFKKEVAKRQGKKRAQAYEKVWWVLLQLQPRRAWGSRFRGKRGHKEGSVTDNYSDYWGDLPPEEQLTDADLEDLMEGYGVDDATGALPAFDE